MNSHQNLAYKLAELEQRFEKHDEEIQAIFEAIRQLLQTPKKDERKIGFRVKERLGIYRIRHRKY